MKEYLLQVLSVIDWQAVTVILVPLIIAGVKLFLTDLNEKVNIPSLAMILGILSEAIISVSTGSEINPLLGAALGAIGVGIREWLDQFKKRSVAKETR